MSVKKMNEENLIIVKKKIKKVPMKKKPLWELALTKGKLLELIRDLPDNTPIVTPSFDHCYDVIFGAGLNTALFNINGITEDYGEELTPQDKYGIRKQVIIIS